MIDELQDKGALQNFYSATRFMYNVDPILLNVIYI